LASDHIGHQVTIMMATPASHLPTDDEGLEHLKRPKQNLMQT